MSLLTAYRRRPMPGTSRQAPMNQLVTFAVMALVLLAGALVPRGYMVAPSAAHGFEITACPDAHPLARMVAQIEDEERRAAHAAMGHHDEPSGGPSSSSQSGGDCAFAGFSAPGLANDVRGWEGPVAIVAAPRLIAYRERVEARLPRLRPPLRGPPLNV
ncbi:hypothetical protein [Erythrobacter sp.]|uniref:hypothetical protein n=1 Tax=Erythrobacter sp. TaxID=1042 RepID=UPI001425E2EC|nr:hypothetical protein [Erythrobacter sp.]QIQ87221.1 MAG: hypothetical protein G9473_11380 [Erythrobacter sp.]